MAYPISDVTRRVVYSGSAGVGPYSFTFEILAQGDIGVYKNEVLLTLTTDYTVTINTDGTGSITLVSAATSSDTIAIFGNKGIQRSTDFVTGGDLFANSLNDELDAQTIFAQQNAEAIIRSIRAPQFDTTSVDMVLPKAADRADGILQFDTDGNPTVVSASQFVSGLSGSILGANYITNNATGDGSTVNFTLSTAPGAKGNLQIYIDGVYQNKASFSLSGTTVTFTEAPPLNASIEFIIGYSIGSYGDAGDVSFTQAGTGAATRTVEAKLNEFVSVKDFGAVGDGVTDDTAAIQAAMAVSSKLDFDVGTYKITSSLDIKNDSANGVAHWFSEGAVITGDCDLLVNVEYSKFERMHFSNITTDHKLITATAGSIRLGEFIDCHFDKAAYHIYHASGALVHTHFVRCWFKNASQYSRYFAGSAMSYSERDCYTWYNNKGLYCEAGTGVVISGGVFEYNDQNAIYFNILAGVAVNDCNITGTHFEVNGNVTPSPDIVIDVANGAGFFMTMQDCRQAGQTIVGDAIDLNLTGSAGGQIYMLNNSGMSLTPPASITFKVNQAIGYPYGDGSPGRVLKCSRLRIDDGTNVSTIKCQLTDVWNGDAVSQVDNINKGYSGTNFALDVGSGAQLTIKKATFGVGTPLAILATNILNDNSGTTNVGSIQHTIDGGGNLILYINSDANGGVVDLTTIKSSGYWIIDLFYIVREWYA